MCVVGAFDRIARNCRIEGDELSPVPDGERKQVDVGKLARSVDARRIHDAGIEQAHVVGPEFMDCRGASLAQAFRYRGDGERVGISRMRQDPDTTVLGDRARGPTLTRLGRKPPRGARMQRVVGIQKGDQDIDVQQCAH